MIKKKLLLSLLLLCASQSLFAPKKIGPDGRPLRVSFGPKSGASGPATDRFQRPDVTQVPFSGDPKELIGRQYEYLDEEGNRAYIAGVVWSNPKLSTPGNPSVGPSVTGSQAKALHHPEIRRLMLAKGLRSMRAPDMRATVRNMDYFQQAGAGLVAAASDPLLARRAKDLAAVEKSTAIIEDAEKLENLYAWGNFVIPDSASPQEKAELEKTKAGRLAIIERREAESAMRAAARYAAATADAQDGLPEPPLDGPRRLGIGGEGAGPFAEDNPVNWGDPEDPVLKASDQERTEMLYRLADAGWERAANGIYLTPAAQAAIKPIYKGERFDLKPGVRVPDAESAVSVGDVEMGGPQDASHDSRDGTAGASTATLPVAVGDVEMEIAR